ncbi:glutaredoxin [Exidia glandulosa HHB12029]|uniref:Glutaredoxin n=1 Tax=Exidia glandulosa HHB12029 TaxID=1314781 RepID=A0A165F473_EXIGL|nr:glutaredoxin [Exidia glandulosa HHB12029]
MLDKIIGGVRAALRRRSTYLGLLVGVVFIILVPVVREPSAISKAAEDVPELHALIYALQRTKVGETLPASLELDSGLPVKAQEWALAADERDMAVWRASARRALQSHPVVVFSKTYCPYSRRAKDLLASFKLDPPPLVFELDTREDGKAIQDALHRLTGRATVPNVIVGPAGESIGGSDDLAALHAAGELLPVLERAIRGGRV